MYEYRHLYTDEWQLYIQVRSDLVHQIDRVRQRSYYLITLRNALYFRARKCRARNPALGSSLIVDACCCVCCCLATMAVFAGRSSKETFEHLLSVIIKEKRYVYRRDHWMKIRKHRFAACVSGSTMRDRISHQPNILMP